MELARKSVVVSDDALARRAASGDRAALADLLERHFDYVTAVCRRVLRHPADAEDARQQALMTAARRVRSFEGRSEFRTWLHRVAVNASLDVLARRRRDPEAVADLESIGGWVPPAETVRLDVDAALARLPDTYRTAVVLRDLCDLEYDDIAERLDIPIGTVRSRIARGREQLAAMLEGYGA